MPTPVSEKVFRKAQTVEELLKAAKHYAETNTAWCKRNASSCPNPEKYLIRAARQSEINLNRILGLPMAKQQDKPPAKKDTVSDIFNEIQKIALQISGVNQNVNSANSNTAATAATTAAKGATGAVAGGASGLLLIGSAILLVFYFWKK